MALQYPDPFVQLKPAIVPLLSVIMFSMGVTLTVHDFRDVLVNPSSVILGTALQYTIMPLAAFVIGIALGLPVELITGLVLVGSSPGGTASNVICYLARGNLALSITLTLVSTVFAVIATPFLTWLYIGRQVPVPVVDMMVSVFKIVVIPVLLGTVLNTYWHDRLRRITPVFPLLSVAAIVLIIAIIAALNKANLATLAWLVAVAVVLHNAVGLLLGYGIPYVLRQDPRTCRTLAIEVGMQNSGLAVALAVKYFGTAAALPGALFSLWHNLTGSTLAALWSRREVA